VIAVDHVTERRLGGEPAPDRFRIVDGLPDADRGYVIREWTDGIHATKGNHKKPFRFWKPVWREQITRVLDMPETRTLVAHHDTERLMRDGSDLGPTCLGFLVWTPGNAGRGWPAIHYAFTRHSVGGVPWRRRGVLSALVDAAELGPRVQYTQHGEHRRNGRQLSPVPMHEPIVEWLRGKGMAVAYTPIEEWLR
jgi:hypothetical protein